MVQPVGSNSSYNPFLNVPGLTDAEQSALDTLLNDLISSSDQNAIQPLTINELYASTVSTLQDLIEALKAADLQGQKNLIISNIDQSNTVIDELSNVASLILTGSQDMTTLGTDAQNVDTQASDVETARDNYNSAVQAYESYPDNSTYQQNLLNARDNLNAAIDSYNTKVATYNDEISTINAARASANADDLATTNGIVPLNPIPDGDKITFTIPPSTLVPTINDNPSQINFAFTDFQNSTLPTAISRLDANASNYNDYVQALTNLESARQALDNQVTSMNSAAAASGFDVSTDYPPLATTYNTLVSDYNTALATAQSERDTYNADVPSGSQFNWDLPTESTIPSTVSSYTPLDQVIDPTQFYENYGASDLTANYDGAYNNFISARDALNNEITAMNQAAQQSGFDVSTDYPPLASTYNQLVDQYNSALASLRTARDDYNAKVPTEAQLSWTISDQSTIPDTTTSYTPLTAITADPPQAIWEAAFQTLANNYNNAVTAYQSAKDTLNSVINSVNSTYQSSGFNIGTDYNNLADTYNAALTDYNNAVDNLLSARDAWNTLATSNTITTGIYAPPITFDIQTKSPLPVPAPSYTVSNTTIYVAPPPLSNLTFQPIYNANVYQFFSTVQLTSLTQLSNGLVSSTINFYQLLLSDIKPDLLSLIFLSRGQVASEIYEPISNNASVASSLSLGSGLSSVVLGLSNPNVEKVLSQVNFAETLRSFINDLKLKNPQGIQLALQHIFRQTGANAILASTQFALLFAFDLLKTQSPESFPINLASYVALGQALVSFSSNGGLTDLVQQTLEGQEAVAAAPNDNRKAIFSSIGNLSAFPLLFAALSDISSISGVSPAFALGLLSLNLSFGATGSQLSLRDALKSIANTPHRSDVTNAVATVLSNLGVSKSASKALSEKLMTAKNPKALIHKALAGQNNASAAANQLAQVIQLASFSPQLQSLHGALSVKKGSPEFEAIQGRLKNAGLNENLANAFVNVNSGSFLQQATQIQTETGTQALITGFQAIRDTRLAQTLSAKLGGNVNDSEGETIVKGTLNTLSGLDRLVNQTLQQMADSKHTQALEKIKDFTTKLHNPLEKPAIFLSQFTEPAKAALRYGSFYWQGTIPQITNMRTDSGPRDINIHV